MINSNYLEKKSILLNQPYLINGIEIFCDDPIKYNLLNLIQSIINIESIKKFKFNETYNNNYNNNININNVNKNELKNYFDNQNNNQKKKSSHQNKKLNRNLSKKMFVGGISPETTKYDLFNFFSKYGEIEYCVVNTEKLTEKPRGFGFVVFHNKISLENCLNDSLNHYINGKWVECKKANGKKEINKKVAKNVVPQNNYNNNYQLQNVNNNLFIQYYSNQLNFTNNNNDNYNKTNLKENNNNNNNKNIIKINIENLNNYINIYNLGNINKNNNDMNDIQKNNDMNYIKKDKKNINNKKIININHLSEKEINNPSKNNQKNSSNIEKDKEKINQLKNLYIYKQFKENNKYSDIKKDLERTKKKAVLNMTKNNKPKYKNNYTNLKLSHISNNVNSDLYKNYCNNELANSKFNDYIQYKLFDINGEEIFHLKSDKNKNLNNVFNKNNNQKIKLSKSFSNDINDIFYKHNILDNELIKDVKKSKKTYSLNSVISTDSSQYSLVSKKNNIKL